MKRWHVTLALVGALALITPLMGCSGSSSPTLPAPKRWYVSFSPEVTPATAPENAYFVTYTGDDATLNGTPPRVVISVRAGRVRAPRGVYAFSARLIVQSDTGQFLIPDAYVEGNFFEKDGSDVTYDINKTSDGVDIYIQLNRSLTDVVLFGTRVRGSGTILKLIYTPREGSYTLRWHRITGAVLRGFLFVHNPSLLGRGYGARMTISRR